MAFSVRDFKFELLKVFAASPRNLYKFNVLGRGDAEGDLERTLRLKFNLEERYRAAKAFDELRDDGLIRPTLSDMVHPEDWCEITDVGREALRRGTLDELDAALAKINPHLLEVRRGAWSALASNQPDSLRQAAHSARELIDQVLKEGAPDEGVKSRPWYREDSSSKSGVTRRMRVKYLMEQFKVGASDSDVAIVESACDVVLAINTKLMAQAHGRSAPPYQDVKDELETAEMALRRILI